MAPFLTPSWRPILLQAPFREDQGYVNWYVQGQVKKEGLAQLVKSLSGAMLTRSS
jgi:hypothetical protein